MTDIAQLHRELVARVLGSAGTAPTELRRAAFDDARVDEPVRTLIATVAHHADRLTDDDVAAVRAAGLDEDQSLRDRGVRGNRPGGSRVQERPRRAGRRNLGHGQRAMRLEILDRGHPWRTKALFAVIRLVSRQPVVDAVKLALYRRGFLRCGRPHPRGDARAVGLVRRRP